MSGQYSRVRVPVQEQIWDLQKKIQLLEGDRKAYYETSQDKIKKNKETIQHLRQEIKQLHKALAGALVSDKKLVQASFQDHHDKMALRNKSGKDIMVAMDQKVCEKANRLNALKHETETKRKQRMNLELQYNKNMEGAAFLQAVEENTSEEAQTLRLLENRLEKTQLKYGEASHVMKVYQRLKAHLQEESVTFQKQLDTLEAEILQHRQQLKELQAMNNNAQLSRDAAKAELRQQEEVMQKERREREKILNEYKKLAEEKRAQVERAERQALRATTHSDELHYERPGTEDTAAEERSNNTLGESFQWIKAVTGVTDVQDITKHYITQSDTLKHLQQLELDNRKQLVQLEEEKARLKEEYEHLKYSGENKLSSEQKLLTELQAHLEDEQKRRDKLIEDLEYVSRITLSIKAGMEHISEKMRHVEVDSIPTVVLSPSSDEYVLDLLSATEAKLLQLYQHLSALDLNNMLQLMEEDEFHASVEGKLPPYNMRVKLPVTQKLDVYEDAEDDDDGDVDTDEDNDSGDNSGDIITRAMLKRQSQQIVDWKTKRKSRPKRRKAKHRSAHEGSPLPLPILVR
ncbi:coiled-coil domain-containing protein 151 isoform X1 [Mobula hypostoma]|uniref:coiled-coil domain-containing protein 151 isoform X1 n=2 Tax=Mobula hypostoma TaxID=723540 RepID=UPI002FC3C72E